MAHANPYTPGQVETLEKAKNELVKLAAVVNQIIANQKLFQRDDGCLADCAVVPHTLSDEVVRMISHFELLGAYAARPYQKGQVVTYRDRMYVCVAPHQGGTVMDTAAWRLIGKAGCGCEGEAAGYDVGYSEGDAAGYARGHSEGEAAGYARGHSEGEAAGTASAAQSAINAAAAAHGASMADASRNADGSYSQLYLRYVSGRLEYGREDKILFYTIVKNNQGFNFSAIGSPYSAQSAKIAQIREPTATKDIKEWASYATPITSEKQYLEALKLVAGVGDIAKFNEK